MNVIIIDDEPLARSIIKEYLQNYENIEVIAECNDGFEGIKAIMQYEPGLIFLDIQMPKINGFEMLEVIENAPPVIFTTAFDEFAIKAFELNAIDYLLKPFSKERFDKALQKFLAQPVKPSLAGVIASAAQATSQNRIVVRDGNRIKIIPLTQIEYLQGADDYVKIVTAEGSFLKKKTMDFFERFLLPQQFVRIHRPYIINTLLITRIDLIEKDSHVVLLNTGARLPASKTGYTRLKEILSI